MKIHQIVYGTFPFSEEGYHTLCHTLGDKGIPVVEEFVRCLRQGFGTAPDTFREALLGFPLANERYYAITGSQNIGKDSKGRPGALCFHGFVMESGELSEIGYNPFVLLEHGPSFCFNWKPASTVSMISWQSPVSLADLQKREFALLRDSLSDLRWLWAAAKLMENKDIFYKSVEGISYPEIRTFLSKVWSALPWKHRIIQSFVTQTYSNSPDFFAVAFQGGNYLPQKSHTLTINFSDPVPALSPNFTPVLIPLRNNDFEAFRTCVQILPKTASQPSTIPFDREREKLKPSSPRRPSKLRLVVFVLALVSSVLIFRWFSKLGNQIDSQSTTKGEKTTVPEKVGTNPESKSSQTEPDRPVETLPKIPHIDTKESAVRLEDKEKKKLREMGKTLSELAGNKTGIWNDGLAVEFDNLCKKYQDRLFDKDRPLYEGDRKLFYDVLEQMVEVRRNCLDQQMERHSQKIAQYFQDFQEGRLTEAGEILESCSDRIAALRSMEKMPFWKKKKADDPSTENLAQLADEYQDRKTLTEKWLEQHRKFHETVIQANPKHLAVFEVTLTTLLQNHVQFARLNPARGEELTPHIQMALDTVRFRQSYEKFLANARENSQSYEKFLANARENLKSVQDQWENIFKPNHRAFLVAFSPGKDLWDRQESIRTFCRNLSEFFSSQARLNDNAVIKLLHMEEITGKLSQPEMGYCSMQMREYLKNKMGTMCEAAKRKATPEPQDSPQSLAEKIGQIEPDIQKIKTLKFPDFLISNDKKNLEEELSRSQTNLNEIEGTLKRKKDDLTQRENECILYSNNPASVLELCKTKGYGKTIDYLRSLTEKSPYLEKKYKESLQNREINIIRPWRDSDKKEYEAIQENASKKRFRYVREGIQNYKTSERHARIMANELNQYQRDFQYDLSINFDLMPSANFNDTGGPDLDIWISVNTSRFRFQKENIPKGSTTAIGTFIVPSLSLNNQYIFEFDFTEGNNYLGDVSYGKCFVDLTSLLNGNEVKVDPPHTCGSDGTLTIILRGTVTQTRSPEITIPPFKENNP